MYVKWLEGLRGLAALYVVVFHLTTVTPFDQLSPAFRIPLTLVVHGHYAVGVFIVLSGYCLMLPVLADPDARLRGGVAGFVARRSRRILPPYYAALACSIPVAYAAQRMK